MIAVTIGHACLTARQTWPLARSLARSPLFPLFRSFAIPPAAISLHASVHRMHFAARCTANSDAANVSPIYLRDRTQLLPTLRPFFFLFSCSSFLFVPLLSSFPFSLFRRSSCPPFPPGAAALPCISGSSFCSRFSRSCCLPLRSDSFAVYLFLSFFFLFFRFDSPRGYIEFFCLHLRGRFLLASLSRFIIVLQPRCLPSPASRPLRELLWQVFT